MFGGKAAPASVLSKNVTALLKHKNYAACQTVRAFLVLNKLVGPWMQVAFPNKWKQYALVDRIFGNQETKVLVLTSLLSCPVTFGEVASQAAAPLPFACLTEAGSKLTESENRFLGCVCTYTHRIRLARMLLSVPCP